MSVASTSEEVSPVTDKREQELVKKNIDGYLKGDTLRITLKNNNITTTHIIYKSNKSDHFYAAVSYFS